MRRFPLIVPLIIVVAALGIFFFSQKTPSTTQSPTLPTSYEYFWSATCPHCAKVEEFLSSWENSDKLKLDKRDVENNRSNVELLYQRAAYCGIPQNQVGVPLIFTPEGKCIVGDEPIIAFFGEMKFDEQK